MTATASSANLRCTRKQVLAEVSEMSGLSPRLIEMSHYVNTWAVPGLMQFVHSGQLKTSPAYEIAKLSEAQQNEIVSGGLEQIKRMVKAIRDWRELQTLREKIARLARKFAAEEDGLADFLRGLADEIDGRAS